jgi:hypothetical protein
MELSTILFVILGLSILSFAVLMIHARTDRRVRRKFMGGPWDGRVMEVPADCSVLYATDFPEGCEYTRVKDTFVWTRSGERKGLKELLKTTPN